MKRVRRPNLQKATQTQSGVDLPAYMRSSFYDAQAQLREQTQVVGNSEQVPAGLQDGDVVARLAPNGGIGIGVSDSRGTVREAILQRNISNWLSDQTGTGVPTTVHFPKSGQFGWYEDTAGPTLYLARNRNGTILKVALT